MVSPELLRRYPFFSRLEDAHLKAIAMLGDEVNYAKGDTLFEADQPANALYLLIEGGVDLHYIVIDRDDPRHRKEFFISELSPGEPVGISALVEPYCYTATARASSPIRVLKIDAPGLRALCEVETKIGNSMMRNIAKIAMGRLNETRIQLVAARA